MKPPTTTLSRRSILRIFPVAAVAAAVALSSKPEVAQARAPQQTPAPVPVTSGHRAIIGVL
ncbi:hypothetical protein [Paenarthrobacter sp. TA1.8]|uniref:hypothetical protein n=1 Tax=Paenarthrobacter sp. TA1.8 TaxID=3400219 RepID=UPI003B433A9F